MAYATAILGDYHLAQDAAQEAFVEAYLELPSLREPAAFAAWFRTIIFKHCDRLMRRKRHPVAGIDAALEVASAEPSPLEALEARETRTSLREAIATLSDAQQQVALLYYMGEHSHAEIAGFLDVSINTVKTRLYAARQRLRKHMGYIEKSLHAARPSRDAKFAEEVQRMIQPEALKKNEPLFWSPGMGTDVWEMFCAAITGDLATIKQLLEKDPALVRSAYEYRTPLSFAVRENQLEVARFLLERGADPINSGTPDTLLQIARDRGFVQMQRLLEGALAGAGGASPEIGDLERVRELLDEDPSLANRPSDYVTYYACSGTPLRNAAAGGTSRSSSCCWRRAPTRMWRSRASQTR